MFNYLKKSILILFFCTTPLIAMEFLGDLLPKNAKKSESTRCLFAEIDKNNINIEPFIKEDTDVDFALKYTTQILSSHDSANVINNEKKLIIIQKLCKRTGLLTNVDQQNNNIFHAIIKKGIPAITALIIAPHLEFDYKTKRTPSPKNLVAEHIEKIFALLKEKNTSEQIPLDLLSSEENYKNKVESLFEKLKNDLTVFQENYPDRDWLEKQKNLALRIHDSYYMIH